ncbi:hypothetical protein KC929_00330 [Patescibacteria group bacterium]|nr:hypothetical protein [Patescibacteria group bacterium]
MGKRINVKDKIKEFEARFTGVNLFKKVLNLSESEFYSGQKKNMRNQDVEIYNKILGTNFFIDWQPIGESASYKIEKILDNVKNKSEKQVKKVKINQLVLF